MRKLLTFEGHMQMTLYEYKIGKPFLQILQNANSVLKYEEKGDF